MPLFSLPSDMLVYELFPFFSLLDMRRLDAAITNHVLRRHLLELYPFFRHEHFKANIVLAAQLEWYISRKVSVPNISIAKRCSAQEIVKIFQLIEDSDCLVKAVNLSHCYRAVGPTHYQIMMQVCTRLQSLNISGCREISSNFLKSLPFSCPQLSHLDVSWCRCLSSTVLSHLCLRANRSITSLNVSFCDHVDDLTIMHLSAGLTCLSCLHMGGCNITDITLTALSCNATSLRELVLHMCTAITDDGVVSLSAGCQSLTTLDLSGCQVTDASVIALSNQPISLTLTTLNLGGCSAISDEAVRAIAQRCLLLTNLSLAECSFVTGDAVIAVCQGCRSLSTLHLCGMHPEVASRCISIWRNFWP